MSYNDRKLRNITGLCLRNILVDPEEQEKQTIENTNGSSKAEEHENKHTNEGRDKDRNEKTDEESDMKYTNDATKRRRNTYQFDYDYSNDYSRLIQINQARMVNTFFSLHYPQTDQIMYVSEVVETNMNPNFDTITIPYVNSNKLTQVIIKVWFQNLSTVDIAEDWKLLIQWDLNLKTLVQVADPISEDQFKDNTVLIKLGNRYYTSKDRLVNESKAIGDRKVSGIHELKSYNFDVIRSINNLDKSIQELQQSKTLISKSIDKLIGNQDYYNCEKYRNEIKRLNLRNKQLSKYINDFTNQHNQLMSQVLHYKIINSKLTELKLEIKPNIQESFNNNLEIIQSNIYHFDHNLPILYKILKLYFKQFSEMLIELSNISEPETDRANKTGDNLFIMGFEFPSSIKDILKVLYYNELSLTNQYDINSDHHLKITQINSCLSQIIKLILILIDLVDLKVYYPMEFKGNYSIIKDFDNRTFPLYYDNRLSERDSNNVIRNELFERGIVLLNKNLLLILYTMNHLYVNYNYQGLDHSSSAKTLPGLLNNIPIDCLDNFAWSLQYLLLYLSAINDSDKQFIEKLALKPDMNITDQLNSFIISQGFNEPLK